MAQNIPPTFETFLLLGDEKKYAFAIAVAATACCVVVLRSPLPLLLMVCMFRAANHSSHRISIQKDSRAKNAVTFIIMKEDHTLGQLLKAYVPDLHAFGNSQPLLPWPHIAFFQYIDGNCTSRHFHMTCTLETLAGNS